MNKIFSIAVIVFTMVLASAVCLAMGPSADSLPGIKVSQGKPASPLKVTITPVYDGAYIPEGTTLDMIVSVTSVSAIDSIKVTLKVTGGAELISGNRHWTLSPVEPEVAYTQTVTVRFPEGHSAAKLAARATMSRGAKGGKYSSPCEEKTQAIV